MKKYLAILTVFALIGCMFNIPVQAAPIDKNTYKYNETIDYSNSSYQNLSNYELRTKWTDKSSTVEIAKDSDVNVLKWTTGGFTARGMAQALNIPLNKPFNANNGEFTLEFRAKLPQNKYRWFENGFMNFETAASKSDSNLTPALRFGLSKISGDYFQPVINGSSYTFMGNVNYNNNYKLYESSYCNKYITYRFDVDPDAKTFRFYTKEDGKTWNEPYKDLQVPNPYTADTTDKFDKGLLPTGTLPTDDIVALSLSSGCFIANATTDSTQLEEAQKEISYYISSIKIQQKPKQTMAYSLDYSKMSTSDTPDEKGYSPWGKADGTTAEHGVAIIHDDTLNKNVLQWTAKNTVTQNEQTTLDVPLNEMSIDTTKGPFSITMNVKLPSTEVLKTRSIMGFPNLVGGTTTVKFGLMSYDAAGWGNGISCGNSAFYTNSTQKIGGTPYLNNGLPEVTDPNRRYYSLGTEIYNRYGLYKFDVNPNKMSFRFFYSLDNGNTWVEPYKDVKFLKVNPTSANDKYEAGELPLYNNGDPLPNVIDKLRFTITEHAYNADNAKKESDVRIASIDIVQGCSVVGSCSAKYDSSNIVSVSFTNYFSDNEGLIVGLYDLSGALKDVIINPTNESTFKKEYAAGDYVKYFIFDDLTNITPITFASKVDITAAE